MKSKDPLLEKISSENGNSAFPLAAAGTLTTAGGILLSRKGKGRIKVKLRKKKKKKRNTQNTQAPKKRQAPQNTQVPSTPQNKYMNYTQEELNASKAARREKRRRRREAMQQQQRRARRRQEQAQRDANYEQLMAERPRSKGKGLFAGLNASESGRTAQTKIVASKSAKEALNKYPVLMELRDTVRKMKPTGSSEGDKAAIFEAIRKARSGYSKNTPNRRLLDALDAYNTQSRPKGRGILADLNAPGGRTDRAKARRARRKQEQAQGLDNFEQLMDEAKVKQNRRAVAKVVADAEKLRRNPFSVTAKSGGENKLLQDSIRKRKKLSPDEQLKADVEESGRRVAALLADARALNKSAMSL